MTNQCLVLENNMQYHVHLDERDIELIKIALNNNCAPLFGITSTTQTMAANQRVQQVIEKLDNAIATKMQS